MRFIEEIRNAVARESADSVSDGWLFTDFAGRDSFTRSLLHLPAAVATRRWIYLVLKNGSAVKIVHTIEPHVLDTLPADEVYTYASREELLSVLRRFSGQTFATQCDANIPVISTIDGGFMQLLGQAGIAAVSAAPLIQRCRGLLSDAAVASHERAAALLYKIVSETWRFISERYAAKRELTEGDVASFILERFLAYALTTDHAPIVAFGVHTADPHYEVPASGGASAREGDVIQLDLWAKERIADDGAGNRTADAAVYADISWVGIYGTHVPAHIAQPFETLCSARDSVKERLERAAAENSTVTGSELDALARSVLSGGGFAPYIKHRTGHGIDGRCHGSGVNLDSVEFPDTRRILPGSCFSVEPGLYFADFGMRTELNIYITQEGFPVISGMKYGARTIEALPSFPQRELLLAKDFPNENHQ